MRARGFHLRVFNSTLARVVLSGDCSRGHLGWAMRGGFLGLRLLRLVAILFSTRLIAHSSQAFKDPPEMTTTSDLWGPHAPCVRCLWLVPLSLSLPLFLAKAHSHFAQ